MNTTVKEKWIIQGLEMDDPKRIKSYKGVVDKVKEYGFLPLFRNQVLGFSVEEMTASDTWWGIHPEEDPWEWRGIIAEEGEVAYGKLFGNKAGFVSKEWYPDLVNYRRDGYDFDSRYEDGLASHKQKLVMDVMLGQERLQSWRLKEMAGFKKGGEKGFDSVAISLQMQTYLTVVGFEKKRNKKNEEYGWAGAVYATPEVFFGEEYVRSRYKKDPKDSKNAILSFLVKQYGIEYEKVLVKMMK